MGREILSLHRRQNRRKIEPGMFLIENLRPCDLPEAYRNEKAENLNLGKNLGWRLVYNSVYRARPWKIDVPVIGSPFRTAVES
jgi:hypothetical protein